MTGARVLVIDDDRSIAQLLAMTFEDAGYEVLRAHDGAEGLQVLEQATPEAIVLDLAMPVMDGETFYRHLRAHEREALRAIPVLIVSAVGATRARRELGAEASMEKPVDPDDVVEAVGGLIERADRRREAPRHSKGVAAH